MVFNIKRKRIDREGNPDGTKAPNPEKRKKILLILLFLALLLSNLLLFSRLMTTRQVVVQQQKVVTQQQKIIQSVQEPPDASSEVAGKWYGLCAKNSIHSIEDFRNTLKNDPLLATHFSDFDWGNARMGKLEESIWTHIAYRNNDKISTTRRVIRLPKGDGYITDGSRFLRTYCCNDYVLAGPKELVSGPDRETGDPRGDETTVTVVPEPTTMLLLGSGILLGVMTRRKRR
jgi:hypothetical protein